VGILRRKFKLILFVGVDIYIWVKWLKWLKVSLLELLYVLKGLSIFKLRLRDNEKSRIGVNFDELIAPRNFCVILRIEW
jgi:hypothetical protein